MQTDRSSMLTPRVAAARLGVSSRYIRQLIHDGRLEAWNVGAGEQRPTWRIPPDALADFLAERTITTKETSSRG